MKFNIHHGQKRSNLNKPGEMYYRPTSPKSMLIMLGVKQGPKIQFTADKQGNIDVSAKQHIRTMIGLGYPIYNGRSTVAPVPISDLLFPDLKFDGEYWRKINQALDVGG